MECSSVAVLRCVTSSESEFKSGLEEGIFNMLSHVQYKPGNCSYRIVKTRYHLKIQGEATSIIVYRVKVMFVVLSRCIALFIQSTLEFLRGNPSEFLIFAFLTSHHISFISTENLLLDKACRLSANLSTQSCDAMVIRNISGYMVTEEVQVQKIVSELQIYITICKGLLPIFCMAFLGAWSDEKGRRKPLIVVPIIGHIISQIGLMVCCSFYEIPIGYVAFFESVPYPLLGGEYLCLTGIYSYMAANTDVESRSAGVGKIIAFNILAIIVGKALGGVLFKAVGYLGVYSVSTLLFVLCVAYILFVLPSEVAQNVEKEENLGEGGKWKFLTEGFTVTFGMEKRKRNVILAVIFAGALSNTIFEGESSIVYIFTRRKFNWDEIDYSIYITFMHGLQLVGTFITITVFMKLLKLSDLVVAIIGIFSGAVYSITSAFSQDIFSFYAGMVGSIFIGDTILSVRAMILTISDKNEIARVNSLFGISNSITPLFGGTIYNFVYRNTLDYFPGAFYLITTMGDIFLLSLFMWIYQQKTKQLA